MSGTPAVRRPAAVMTSAPAAPGRRRGAARTSSAGSRGRQSRRATRSAEPVVQASKRGQGPPVAAAAEHGWAMLSAGAHAEAHFAAALAWHAHADRVVDRARTQLAYIQLLRRATDGASTRERTCVRSWRCSTTSALPRVPNAPAWSCQPPGRPRASGTRLRLSPRRSSRPRRVRESGQVEPGGRGGAVPQPAHGRVAPQQRLPEVGRQLPRRARAAHARLILRQCRVGAE